MRKLLFGLIAGVALASTGQDLKVMQYGAYLKVSKSLWERCITSAEAKHGENSFEKAMAVYGLLNSTMATQDEDTFDEYVDVAADILKEIIEEKPDWGEPKAVLSSIYGLRIAYDPWKGMIYGSKSSSLVSEAFDQQPESPLVQKLYASSKLYTPSMFGGDAELALEVYEKCVKNYEMGETSNDWMYLDALMGLAQAQIKEEKGDDAKVTLEKALKIEPEFGWAKGLMAQLK